MEKKEKITCPHCNSRAIYLIYHPDFEEDNKLPSKFTCLRCDKTFEIKGLTIKDIQKFIQPIKEG